MDLYHPISSSACWRCRQSPTVGIKDPTRPSGLIDTELCGPCFFSDHAMIDTDLWNLPSEDTE